MAKRTKTEIVKTAFDNLYSDLGSDLSSLLTSGYLTRTGNKWKSKGLSSGIGCKWACTTASHLFLLEVTPTELGTIKATPKISGRFYKDNKTKSPIEYRSKGHPGVSFLLNSEWGTDRNFNKAACDLINSVANSLKKNPYILPKDESEMMTPKKGSKATSSAPPSSSSLIPPLATKEKHPLNLILFGPPGTGKTYHTIEKAVEIISGASCGTHEDAKIEFERLKIAGQIVFTTFHQSMSYEDFIEGIKPELGGSSLGYKIEDGIFKQISNAAKEKPDEKFVIIIDEINRGNVANIFGELITLIEEDKRLGNSEQMTCTLPYSKDIFGVPNNLYMIGTMNTADRSVEALDSALRRRFTFEEMMPKPELWEKEPVVDGVNLQEFLTVINRRISLLKDREHQIGHSYLIKVKNKEELIDVIFKNVIPLLQEYFYGDYEKIQMVLGKTFIPEDKDTFNVAFATTDSFDKPEKVFRIARKDEVVTDIDSALESIKFGFEKAHAEPTEEPEHAE